MTTFAVTLHRERRITVELIEAEIERARAVIHAPEIDRVQALLDEARAMFDAGRVDYAMGLGQAAWEGANGLFNALAVRKPVIDRAKSMHHAAEANTNEARKAAERKADWQARASAIWSRNPNWSAANVAREIAKETGEKANTIRRRIEK